jgi:hypothetical protein
VVQRLELGRAALSRIFSEATSSVRSDMERECSRWADVCKMLDRVGLVDQTVSNA